MKQLNLPIEGTKRKAWLALIKKLYNIQPKT